MSFYYDDQVKFIKIDPSSMKQLKQEYSLLLSNCEEYSTLSFEEFTDCRNAIYICIDRNAKSSLDSFIYGIVGIKQSTLDEENITETPLHLTGDFYYCKPNRIIYSVEFFHFGDKNMGEELDDNKTAKICAELLRQAVQTKNDGFIFMQIKCPTLSSRIVMNELLYNGFILYKYSPLSDETWYMKPPSYHELELSNKKFEV